MLKHCFFVKPASLFLPKKLLKPVVLFFKTHVFIVNYHYRFHHLGYRIWLITGLLFDFLGSHLQLLLLLCFFFSYFSLFIRPVGDRNIYKGLFCFHGLVRFWQFSLSTWFAFLVLEFLRLLLCLIQFVLRSNVLLFIEIDRLLTIFWQLLLVHWHDLMDESFFYLDLLNVFWKLVVHFVDRYRLLFKPLLSIFELFFTVTKLQTVIVSPTVKLPVH